MSFTVCVWPLSSPFIQNFWRERLQKCVLPVATVFSSDARFIHAIISTRPVFCSCTMAGISPVASSNFNWSKKLIHFRAERGRIEYAQEKGIINSRVCGVAVEAEELPGRREVSCVRRHVLAAALDP